MSTDRILLTGANGQIGVELTAQLRHQYGKDRVLATDLKERPDLRAMGPFELLDVTNAKAVDRLFDRYRPTQVYHLASLLSATAEHKPQIAWNVNVQGLLYVLEACKQVGSRLFWPSSIAVFGPNTPRTNTPQRTIIDPETIYGIGKQTGERWCVYYAMHHGLDVRSLRYPGLISYAAMPGGGTTDYSVDMFFQAVEHGHYECYLTEDTALPMMYMEDALRGTFELMDAPVNAIRIRDSYNFASMSFTAGELAAAIANEVPGFEVSYAPDSRQAIADTWPASIDDSEARKDWGWKPDYDLDSLVGAMLAGVREKLGALSS